MLTPPLPWNFEKAEISMGGMKRVFGLHRLFEPLRGRNQETWVTGETTSKNLWVIRARPWERRSSPSQPWVLEKQLSAATSTHRGTACRRSPPGRGLASQAGRCLTSPACPTETFVWREKAADPPPHCLPAVTELERGLKQFKCFFFALVFTKFDQSFRLERMKPKKSASASGKEYMAPQRWFSASFHYYLKKRSWRKKSSLAGWNVGGNGKMLNTQQKKRNKWKKHMIWTIP